jgi:hypothetical protein
MPSFLIESYKLRTEIQRFGSPVVTRRNRIIEIVSPPVFHSIVTRALLNFSTDWESWSGPAAVGHYTTTNPAEPSLGCWLPASEYPFWYDVLRSERPLSFFYEITPIGGASYVSTIAVGSTVEPVGEGPGEAIS